MEYWKEHFNTNATQFASSLFKQVDMTVNGKEVGADQVDFRVKAMVENLNLTKDDILLDICCGNGLLTDKLSGIVNFVYAVDFSEGLIEIARKKNQHANCRYDVGDLTKIDLQQYNSINKLSVYSGLQYISLGELDVFFKKIAACNKPLLAYFSNVPDKEKLWNYYDTDAKKEFYFQREEEGKPHIGTWFNKNEIAHIAESSGLTCKFLEIDKAVNTSYYRFDILLSKE
jgi:predicted TPR repeat methyltransferase